MTLLVKILLITTSYLPGNGNISNHFNYFNPENIFVEIIPDPAEDSITENIVPSLNQQTKQEEDDDFKFYKPCIVKNAFSKLTHINSLDRLLPFLIDQPPPQIS